MLNSQRLFSMFAPYYGQYAKKKAKYLRGIDDIIIKSSPSNCSLLDAGCGDTIRGQCLAKSIKAKKALMVDNCEEMLSLCKMGPKVKTHLADLTKSSDLNFSQKFDVIICLWNVLGHIPTEKGRLSLLNNLHKLAHQDSIIFIDVSNRYNALYYGLGTAFKNLALDILLSSRKNDYSYDLVMVRGKKVNVTSHFFSPFEMRSLLRRSGFKIEREMYIDYRTGKHRSFYFLGQLLYVLKPI